MPLRLVLSTFIFLLSSLAIASATPIAYTLTFTAPYLHDALTNYTNQFVTITGYADSADVYADQYGALHDPLSQITIQIGSQPLLYAAPGEEVFLNLADNLFFASVFIEYAPLGYAFTALPPTPFSLVAGYSPSGTLTIPLATGGYFGTNCLTYVVVPPFADCRDPLIPATFSAAPVAAASPVPEPSSLLLLGTGLLAITQTLRRRCP